MAASTTLAPATETTSTAPARYYAGLDGLRGVAILAVFFSHFNGGHTAGNRIVHLLASIADAGWVGVDLFFVLSGFLITGILFDTAHSKTRAKNFYARRALRIFPVFYGVLAALLLLTPVLHFHWRPGHLLYFLYLSNLIPVVAPHLIPPGIGFDFVHVWSLAVEEQFYLLWPLIVWNIKDRKILLYISATIIVAAFLLRCFLSLRGVDPNIIYQLLFTRADSLVCGGALALLVRGPGGRHLPVLPVALYSGAAVLTVFILDGNGLHNSALMSTIGYTAIALFCACIVYSALNQKTWIYRISQWQIFRFFGRYSYGLYIYHGVLLVFLIPFLPRMQQTTHSVFLGGILYLLFSLLISLSLAMLSFHYFEAPILKLKRRFA